MILLLASLWVLHSDAKSKITVVERTSTNLCGHRTGLPFPPSGPLPHRGNTGIGSTAHDNGALMTAASVTRAPPHVWKPIRPTLPSPCGQSLGGRAGPPECWIHPATVPPGGGRNPGVRPPPKGRTVDGTQARCQRAVVLRRHRAVPHEDVVETLHIREGDEAELGIGKDGGPRSGAWPRSRLMTRRGPGIATGSGENASPVSGSPQAGPRSSRTRNPCSALRRAGGTEGTESTVHVRRPLPGPPSGGWSADGQSASAVATGPATRRGRRSNSGSGFSARGYPATVPAR